MLILNKAEVTRLLPMKECIRLMSEALAQRAGGQAVQPLRTILRLPDGSGLMGTMPAAIGSPAALGVKIVTVFPGNAAAGRDSHQGAVLLMDPDSGVLAAVLEAGAVTAIRTAAVSGVATEWLARRDADDLAILGAGVQAETHLDAVNTVRHLRRVRIWNRTPERAAKLVRHAIERHSLVAEVCPTVEAAVRGASIICTTTASTGPLLMSSWVAAGAHINAVGSSTKNARELESALVQRSVLFVDARESALNEAGDILTPMAEGLFRADHIAAELGEVLIGQHRGRESADAVTLFKSLGLGIEDVAAARFVVAEAERLGVGQRAELL
ncbi:MAG TPA: ornithine cyclodeaminase family protein [Gemmatimonadales bacterium]|nr:ornithine cyclodeaminase family protein [Gemmatimonadales bacterium]